jgi:hypothetical protein
MDVLEDMWNSIRDAVPGNVVGAVIVLIVGWIVAWLISKVVERVVRHSGFERRLGRYMDGDDSTQSDSAGTVGRVVFYLIMLFVVIAVLDLLQLQLATEPMSAMLAGIFGFIPNIIGALVLVILAFILAKILRAVVFRFSRTAQLDERLRAAEGREAEPDTTARSRGGERFPLSRGLAEVAFVLVFLLFLPAILGALQLGGLLEPITVLLTNVLGFLPNLVAAALILIIGWFLARIVARIVTNFLSGAGFDGLPARFGFGAESQAGMPSGWTPSRVAGTLVLVAIMWFAVIQALEVLRFVALAALLVSLLVLAGRILLGLFIIAIGLWLARVAARAIRGSVRQQPNLLAFTAQAAIVLLFGAMGLRHMGVADSIINLAFAILFGAIGIAVAVAFGIGGRGAAGRLVDRWVTEAETGRLDSSARDTMGGGPTSGQPPTV